MREGRVAMSNILRLFKSDIKHMFSNVVSCIIAIGLIVMPSIFAWYNIIACWNVFDNTGNIRVAVANTDEGYKSDLIPVQINVGDMVVSALRANDQIDWEFCDEEAAIDGARSGQYYAAVVIPKQFSRDMLTFYSDDVEHAQIIYYSNEKSNAISPKVTDTGADTISYEVNSVFAKTLSEISLALANSISKYADEMDVNGRISDLASHVEDMADDIDRTADVLVLYGDLITSAQKILDDCSRLIVSAEDAVEEIGGSASEGMGAIGSLGAAVSSSADLLELMLTSASDSFAQISDSLDNAFDTASGAMTSSAGDLRSYADSMEAAAGDYRDLADSLDGLAASMPGYESEIRAAAASLRAAAAAAEGMSASLRTAADNLDAGIADANGSHEEVKAFAESAKANIDSVRAQFNSSIKPGLQQLASSASSLVSNLSVNLGGLGDASDALIGTTDSIGDALSNVSEKMDKVTEALREASGKVRDVANAINEALVSGDSDKLRNLLSADTDVLASALSAPVGIERHAIFASTNFGSAMAPFYSALGMFIGSLLILVVVKPTVSKRARKALTDPKPREMFFGRFLTMAGISLAQTTLMGLGNIFFLQVQVVEPVLLMLVFWFGGLVYTFLIYAFVSAFANLGKALAVILLIMQVTGCGGSYPLQILPEFVQNLSPWLPATHVVNAMRSAMFGVFNGDYWVQMGELALFLIPAAIIGLVLRRTFEKFMKWYVGEVESTEVIA